jgi:HK97 family phage prohead protease
MIGGREIRTFATPLEIRDSGSLEFRLEGYASVTGVDYDMGTYTERIAPGAFTKTLAKRPDVMLLANHEGLPYARTLIPAGRSGHLALSEDRNGLHFAAQLDRNDPDAETLVRKIRSGLLDGASFVFKVTSQDWFGDGSRRTIQAVDIDRGDVSVCNEGANPAAVVDARSRERIAGNPDLRTHLAIATGLRLRGRVLGTQEARTLDLIMRNELGRR